MPRALSAVARTRASAALVAMLAGVVLAGPAAAEDHDLATLSFAGVVEQVAVDDADPTLPLQIRTFVETEGVLVDLPDTLAVPAASGQAVSLEVVGDPGLSRSQALAEVAVPEADDLAQVVDVELLAATTLAAGSSSSVLGAHTLTVLPVYWSAPDSATVASLGALAASTGQYWAEQSAGQITVQSTVRGWAQIADPGTCDPSTLWNLALAAHGMSEPTSARQHVLVYFPARNDCQWAGLGSLPGSRVWVNGAQNADVFAHEFGHNLGLGHAGTATCGTGSARVSLLLPVVGRCGVSAYGDRADVMGIAMSGATGNLTTGFADFLGLASVVRPTVGSTTTVTLAPLAQVTAVRSVALDVSGGTVYVDFRPANDRDVRVTSWAGVQVHLRTVDPVYGYPTSYLLDMNPTTSVAFASPSLGVSRTWAVTGTSTEVTVTAVGATATVRVRPATTPAVAASWYVTQVYRDLFGRSPDPTGLATWTSALVAGTPRVAVANSITGSTEYRSGLIRESYLHYLGRSAEPAGLASWLEAMRGGLKISDMEAGFVASDEYYLRAGGSDSAWVRQLYRDVLGRSASGAEVASWVSEVRAAGRFAVARGFLLSSEHLSDVIDGYYRDLLGRRLDATGRATWVSAIQGGARLEAIIGSIIASDEYWAGAQR